jgi:hypothetical protein
MTGVLPKLRFTIDTIGIFVANRARSLSAACINRPKTHAGWLTNVKIGTTIKLQRSSCNRKAYSL